MEKKISARALQIDIADYGVDVDICPRIPAHSGGNVTLSRP
jgi:hypothetical protein